MAPVELNFRTFRVQALIYPSTFYHYIKPRTVVSVRSPILSISSPHKPWRLEKKVKILATFNILFCFSMTGLFHRNQ